MTHSIKSAVFEPAKSLGPERALRLPILLNEIPGVQTFACVQTASKEQTFSPVSAQQSILFFLKGAGLVRAEGKTFAAEPYSVFIPPHAASYSLLSETALEYLEIVLLLSIDDLKMLSEKQSFLPYFVRYQDCKTYKEKIKSEKTVNRTIVPENILPRFCMGSVQTTGPDAVAPHKHPMLEQLFFGLPQNQCTVTADALQAPFGELVLLHIPLGSDHGVRVEAGHQLHYLWLDFFKDHAGVEWIKKMHTPTDK